MFCGSYCIRLQGICERRKLITGLYGVKTADRTRRNYDGYYVALCNLVKTDVSEVLQVVRTCFTAVSQIWIMMKLYNIVTGSTEWYIFTDPIQDIWCNLVTTDVSEVLLVVRTWNVIHSKYWLLWISQIWIMMKLDNIVIGSTEWHIVTNPIQEIWYNMECLI